MGGKKSAAPDSEYLFSCFLSLKLNVSEVYMKFELRDFDSLWFLNKKD